MKKIILIIITFLVFAVFCKSTEARDFWPKGMNAISDWGIGVYIAPKEIQVYSKPDAKSKLVENIKWDELGITALNKDLSSKDVFLAFLPQQRIVLMNVKDESDDWCEVIYNQTTNERGWVKKADAWRFLTWYDFMNTYGKERGVYVFHDIPDSYKKLRTNPVDDASYQKDFGYIPDESRLSFIKGNWMLIKFLNFDNSETIGWTKWRNEEGKLFAFPLLDNN